MSASKPLLLVSLLLIAVVAHAQRTNFAGDYVYRNQTNLPGRSDASDFPTQISVWQTQQNITIHYENLVTGEVWEANAAYSKVP